MTRLEWAIAWRYMRSRRQSSLLSFISMISVGGVIVGVSALIVTIGVMNGLQIDLREKILLGSPDVSVLTHGADLRMPDWQTPITIVRAQPGVVAAAPFVLTEALASNRDGFAQGVKVRGVPLDTVGQPQVTDIRERVVEGDFRFAASDGTRNGVVLGRLLAQRLLAFVGDSIRLLTFGNAARAFIDGGQLFEVTGIFETGMYEYDFAFVYMNIDALRDLAGFGHAVTGIEVRTQDRWGASGVAAQLDSALGFPYRTEDWTAQNASLFQALKLEKLAMTVILLLIVIVAAFNIVGTLTMVVRDKTREIGILKAMGMRARSIRNVFVLQGLVIGVVGTTIGLVIGVALGVSLDRYRLIPLDPQVYFLDHLPIILEVPDTAAIVLASIVIATVATLYPARQAGRLFPVEAIRDE
jgi:lipoprotein-releasing system permease protein